MSQQPAFDLFDFLDEKRQQGGWRAGLANVAVGFAGNFHHPRRNCFYGNLSRNFPVFCRHGFDCRGNPFREFRPGKSGRGANFFCRFTPSGPSVIFIFISFPKGVPGCANFSAHVIGNAGSFLWKLATWSITASSRCSPFWS